MKAVSAELASLAGLKESKIPVPHPFAGILAKGWKSKNVSGMRY